MSADTICSVAVHCGDLVHGSDFVHPRTRTPKYFMRLEQVHSIGASLARKTYALIEERDQNILHLSLPTVWLESCQLLLLHAL